MGKKVFGALLLIAAIAIYLTIREQGVENAFGGVFAPVESRRATPLAELAMPSEPVTTGGTTDYKRLTDDVRQRVDGAVRGSSARASRP